MWPQGRTLADPMGSLQMAQTSPYFSSCSLVASGNALFKFEVAHWKAAKVLKRLYRAPTRLLMFSRMMLSTTWKLRPCRYHTWQ